MMYLGSVRLTCFDSLPPIVTSFAVDVSGCSGRECDANS